MKLISENVAGNLHQATNFLNKYGVYDVVAMDSSGTYTVVVYRVTDEEYEEYTARHTKQNGAAT